MFADVPPLAGRTELFLLCLQMYPLWLVEQLFLLCLQMYPLWLVELSCFCYVRRCTLSGW